MNASSTNAASLVNGIPKHKGTTSNAQKDNKIMPRKRMLWPGYFESEQLAQLSLPACRTYEGFWCYGDDRGRMKDDPDQLWADIWIKRRKVDNIGIEDVADHLDALVDNGQLCRYEVGGDQFLHVISWDEHQKISHPTPSKLPPCEHHQHLEWSEWWRDIDTATERWRSAEKAARAAKRDSLRDSLSDSRSRSGVTHSQSSLVQSSSVKASSGGNIRQFTRPSQRGIS